MRQYVALSDAVTDIIHFVQRFGIPLLDYKLQQAIADGWLSNFSTGVAT
jgi:hypothetical protein